jgi:hypothetical protein
MSSRLISGVIEAVAVVVSSVVLACLLLPACALRPPGGFPRAARGRRSSHTPPQNPYSRLVAKSARRLQAALAPAELQPV